MLANSRSAATRSPVPASSFSTITFNESSSSSSRPSSDRGRFLFCAFSTRAESAVSRQVSSLSILAVRLRSSFLISAADASAPAKASRLPVSDPCEPMSPSLISSLRMLTEWPVAEEAMAVCRSGSPDERLARRPRILPATGEFHSPTEYASWARTRGAESKMAWPSAWPSASAWPARNSGSATRMACSLTPGCRSAKPS